MARPSGGEKKVVEGKMCVSIFSTTLSELFLILRRIQGNIILNIRNSSCGVSVVLLRF